MATLVQGSGHRCFPLHLITYLDSFAQQLSSYLRNSNIFLSALGVTACISASRIMSSRNRGRANHNNQDADEERRLWAEIKTRARDVKEMTVCKPFPFGFFSELLVPLIAQDTRSPSFSMLVYYVPVQGPALREPLQLSSRHIVYHLPLATNH